MMILSEGNMVLKTTDENDPELVELLNSEDILNSICLKKTAHG